MLPALVCFGVFHYGLMVERTRIRETRFDRLFGLGNRLLVGALLVIVMYRSSTS